MTLINRLSTGLGRLFRRTREEQDMDEELREFLEASIERKTQAGMTRDAAMRAARRELGNAEVVKDQIRDIGWESIVEQLFQDIRYAVRSLRKAPGLSAVTVASLALGIGATAAIFQLEDAVRLRPLPVDQQEQLVEIRMANPDRARMGTFAGRRPLFTNALWEELRQRQQAFSGVVAWSAYPVNLSDRGEAQFAQGLWVSGDFFGILGVAPHLGREPQSGGPDRHELAFSGRADVFRTLHRPRDPTHHRGHAAGAGPRAAKSPAGTAGRDRPCAT